MLFSLITIYQLIKLWIKIYLILCQSQSSKDIPKLYYHHHFGYYCASNLCYRSVSSEYSVIMRVAWLMFQHLFFCRIMSANLDSSTRKTPMGIHFLMSLQTMRKQWILETTERTPLKTPSAALDVGIGWSPLSLSVGSSGGGIPPISFYSSSHWPLVPKSFGGIWLSWVPELSGTGGGTKGWSLSPFSNWRLGSE